MSPRRKVMLGLAIAVPVLLVVLRLFGLIIPFKVPTSAMAPAIKGGDSVLMEGLTGRFSKPRRGDIVVFIAKDFPPLVDGVSYVKRVVGLPGERLRIGNGRVYVNGNPIELTNAAGPIRYVCMPGSAYLKSTNDTVTVPERRYFVLGDSSTNSLDSRYWGFVPFENVRGRICFCFWPPTSIGIVR